MGMTARFLQSVPFFCKCCPDWEIQKYTYKIDLPTHWENRMTVTCLPEKEVKKIFKGFNQIYVGKELYSLINLKDFKSFWIITAIK